MLTTARLLSVGELALDRRDLELDHVRPGVVDRRRDFDPLADPGVDARDRLAVAPHRELDRLAVVGAVEDARDDDLVLADDAVARRLDQFDAPVTLALVAGDERVQRGVEAERGRRLRECRGRSPSVIRIAPPTRSGGASASALAQRGEQFRALGVGFLARRFDDAQIDVAERLQPRLDFVARPSVCRGRSPMSWLPERSTTTATMSLSGRRFSCTRLGSQRPRQQQRQASARSQRAAQAAPDERDGDRERRRRQRIERRQRQERGKGDRPGAQRESLSRMSLACT